MNRGKRRPFEDNEGGDRYFKRRRTASYTEKKEEDPIKSCIITAGENAGTAENSIEKVAQTLETELGTQKAKILQLLVEVVTTHPEKCSIYSTLAGLLNAKNYNFGGEYVETLVKTFKEQLKTGNWGHAQYTLRFISDLVNSHVISATSLLQLYDTFMEGAVDSTVPQVRRDWLVFAILNCLPWVGRELYDKKEQTVERLMMTIDNFMRKRKRTHVGMLRVWSTDEYHKQEEYLECLWLQVEKLKLDGWMEKHIARPYIAFDSVLCEALQHNLPQISLPPHHENMKYPAPSVVYRMFDYTDCPEGGLAPVLPGTHSIERYLIEQELRDILRKFHNERRECTQHLLGYQHNNRVPLEYMIVEVIFGELFRLPTPEYLEICYGSVLIELCRKSPSLIPQVLAQTTELLFERIDTMHPACIDRFANWFSYHLSNFQFRWSWDDWSKALELDLDHPKPKFIAEVIIKCMRLSYHERIVELVPKSFEKLIPLQNEPLYKFADRDASEDYRYENDPPHSHHNNGQQHPHPHPNSNRGSNSSRKASLPNYMLESSTGGESYYNSNYNHHQQMLNQQHSKLANGGDPSWGPASLEEDTFTSGYYSSENNNGNGQDSRSGGGSNSTREIVLKPTSRERTYQEEVTVQKAIAVKTQDKSGNSPGRVVTHRIYTQNGEVFAEQEGMFHQDIIVNSMTVAGGGGTSSGRQPTHMQQQEQHSRSPAGNAATLPRNHAMRSSLTIGVDASGQDAYYENDRREKEQWLNELEKQREEQRYRKMMEKEERRPRWGDRGIGVGHFWEPSDSENSHLPAPPQTSRNAKGGNSNGSITRSESHAGGEDYAQHYSHPQYQHPGQSNTPPAWLERSLTRMQSSKSQPSLHDPGYTQDLEYGQEGNTLNKSASDLRNAAGYCSPNGETDRTFLRGQNVPIDPDTLTEREKKRIANQEHLEALKKQIEERQQAQKEEKERQLQEEREQEMRMAKQRELELQRLEMEKRGRMPVNGDMPNCIEDAATTSEPSSAPDMCNGKSSKISSILDRATNHPMRDPGEEKDIEIVQRQSVMVVSNSPDEDDKTTTESSSASLQQHRQSRQDQCVMTDTSDQAFERTLTPSMQRSRSLSMCRSSREFGTQTELSEGSSSSGNSSSESGKNCNKNRSHNSLIDKKAKEKEMSKKEEERKKSEERPRWGSNPVKKQYIKQSEKDPNYISRMKRRTERLKRMEEERSTRADTGTESEDVNIPFYRIRQRRNNEVSPPKKLKGIAPLKAIAHFLGGKTEKEVGNSSSSSSAIIKQKQDAATSPKQSNKGPWKALKNESSPRLPDMPSMKNAKSESHLNHNHNHNQQAAAIIDRNFGSVAGLNGLGTSEESSGFSTPFLPRRENLGTGSTESGSGTTGSGSGIQSPDLVYHSHTYQATKASREERKYTKMTSGRDSHSNGNGRPGKNGKGEFSSAQKGFIHQQDFDEMPIKASSKPPSFIEEEIAKLKENEESEAVTVPKGVKKVSAATIKRQQRNRSLSPTRKPKSQSPVKLGKSRAGKDLMSKSFEVSDLTPRQGQNENLPDRIPSPSRPSSPPVPALLKKMQMGLQPDESGRISSLPKEFPDILGPLPSIPIRLMSPINPTDSRLSSATSGVSSTSAGKIDIDIAVMPRRSPEIIRLFAAAEERIKQRQLTAILATGNESARSRRSFEADIGNISINLEPVMLYPRDAYPNSHHDNGVEMDKFEFELPAVSSARLSIRSQTVDSPRSGQTPRGSDAARHEAFITSILNRKEVKEQLSARESELSEKGIIEFSIRLPSNSSGDDYLEEYKDPLLTERRRHTTQWLYGGQSPTSPQKQAILTNLATLKRGLSLQEEWKVNHSDTE